MVERLGLKPFWASSSIGFPSKYFMRGSCIKCSRILRGSGSREMGHRSLGLEALVILGMGITVAIFHLFG